MNTTSMTTTTTTTTISRPGSDPAALPQPAALTITYRVDADGVHRL